MRIIRKVSAKREKVAQGQITEQIKFVDKVFNKVRIVKFYWTLNLMALAVTRLNPALTEDK